MYKNAPKSILDESMPFGGEAAKAPATEAPGKVGLPTLDAAYRQWQHKPDAYARSQFLRAAAPTIDKAIYTHAGRAPSSSVRSQAKLMALKSLSSYNPQKGTLQTHIISQLQGLQRAAAKGQQIISIPERVAIDRQNLQRAEQELQDHLGRDPSDMELANHLGLSLKRIAYIRQARPAISGGALIDEEGAPMDVASDIPGNSSAEDMWLDMVYHDLGDVDRVIVDYTLGRNGAPQLSNQQIAERLGISQGAVSQRKAKIQNLLDNEMGPALFGG